MPNPDPAPEMQLAEILSDLVSLRPGVCVCLPPLQNLSLFFDFSTSHTRDPNTVHNTLTYAPQDPDAALALVSARPSSSTSAPHTTAPAPNDPAQDDDDKDLQRARELVGLHYDVRERCKRGELGRGLEEARSAVERALG